MPIRKRSIEEIILNSKSLLFVTSALNKKGSDKQWSKLYPNYLLKTEKKRQP